MPGVKNAFKRGQTRGKRRSRPYTKPKVTRKGPAKRTATVAKKRGTKRKRTMPEHVQKHISGFLNPFERTGGAKIMDGAAIESLPLSHKVVKEVKVNKDSVTDIILFPGLHCGMMTEDTNQLPTYFDFATDSSMGGKIYFDDLTDGDDNKDSVRAQFDHTGGIAKWRTVSQALKLTLLNTDDTNDGWFESVRVPYKARMNDWQIRFPVADGSRGISPGSRVDMTDGVFSPKTFFTQALDNLNLPESESYNAGSLKDLHKYQWNLLPVASDVGFQNMEQYYAGSMADASDLGFPTALRNAILQDFESNQPSGSFVDGDSVNIDLVDGRVAAKAVYQDFVDQNHDFIYIRIHGGSGQEGAATTGSKILAELAVNQEVVYANDSILAKHMTSNKTSDEAAHKRARAFKASTNIGSASMYKKIQ